MRIPIRALLPFCALLCIGAPSFGAAADRWVEVRSPHFVVVSDAGEKQARATAIQFEQIRRVFREALPSLPSDAGPVITILAVKDERSLSALLPEFWVKGRAHPAGMFESAMNEFYIAVELDAPGLNPYATIYHEYYHSLTTPYYPDLPTWLCEGLADFFGNSEVNGKTATVGEASADLLYQLSTSRMIPLDVLFRVDRSSPYYNENSKVTMFYAESWALVHYLLIGENQAHKAMFNAYFQALQAGDPSAEAARKAFGDLGKLQSALEDYVQRQAFYEIRYPAPAKIAESELQTRGISAAEAAAYRGGFLAVRGRTQEATAALEEALQLDPGNARAYANFAIAQFTSGERQKALDSASRAIALAPSSPLTHYLRAYLTFETAPGATNPQIEEDLRQALAGDANFAPPYALLAVYLASQQKDLDEALGFAQKAASLEPGNSAFLLAEARVLTQLQHFTEARMAATRARSSAATSQELLQADVFLSSLDQTERYAATTDGSRRRLSDAEGDGEGEPLQATGVVSSVVCDRAPQLKIATAQGTLSLRFPMNGGVQIQAPEGVPSGFSPCDLQGKRVAVKYRPDVASPDSGTIDVLELVPAGP